jgi:hypothetical protein
MPCSLFLQVGTIIHNDIFFIELHITGYYLKSVTSIIEVFTSVVRS